jgi:trimeric autotransporter adhesin
LKNKVQKNRRRLLYIVLTAAVSLAALLLFASPKPALAANPGTINFQGKVVNATGSTNVSDGSYTFVFRLYQNVNINTYNPNTLSCAADTNCWWEETDTLTVTSGVFQVELGATCAFTSACNSGHSGIDFNSQNALSLTMKFSTDAAGYMTPLMHLQSTPYAYNADKLGGLAASGFIQNTTSPQSSSNFNISGTGVAATALQTPLLQTAASTDLLLKPTTGLIKVNTASVANEIRIFENNASPTNYTSITYGNISTNSGNLTIAAAGTTTVGNGTGAVTINAGSGSAVNITGHANSTWQTDTGGSLTIQGGSTLSLLSTTTSAASLDSGTTGNVTVGTGANSKAITIGSTTSGTTVSLVGGTTSNTAITLSTSGAGGITIDTGTTGNINIGNNANSKAIAVGNTQTGTTFTATTGGTVLSANNSGATVKSNTNTLTAFQVQNSSGTSVFNINTLSSGLNLIPNSSVEQNINNWVAKATPTTGPIWDNAAGSANFGSGALKFINDAAGDGAAYSFPFKASTQYSLSFYAKASVSSGFTIGRQDVGADIDTGCTNGTNSITITTSYTQFTCTFTTGSTIGVTNFYLKQSGAGTPTIFVDGITLVAGSSALAYTNPGDIQIDNFYNNISLNADQNPEIQPWQLSGNAIPTTSRRSATTVNANGYVYFIGGTTANGSSGAPVTTVNYGKINADGSTGSWNTTTVLPVALYGHSSVVANGYLYVMGGCSDSSTTAACTSPVSTVYYSKLNGDGTVGTWQTATNAPLPAARGFGSAISVGGFIYYLGGYNATAQTAVYSSKTQGDGSLSAWTTTGVTALGTGRYGLATVAADGNIYAVGGCSDAGALCNTAITTVEYAVPTSTGTLGSWTAATSLNTATGFHTTAVLNGYMYVFGGRQSSAPVNTVSYSKITSTSNLGVWTASNNPLPVARQQFSYTQVNGYIYALGGFDGTTTMPTSVYYTTGARVLVYGSLDLVGLTGQGLSDSGGGGTLTAGTIRAIGDLRVDGYADFNNGLSVDSAINVNAVSATAGQNVFNINNSSSNSIFNIKHMGTNFGSLATAGAFLQKNSYFGEEFNVGKANTCAPAGASGSAINSWARGDYGGGGSGTACSATANTTINAGEMSFTAATPNTAAANFGTCAVASPGVTTVNGIEQITATSNTGTSTQARCAENISGTTTTSNRIYAAANLPVVTMKVKPSTLSSSNNAQVLVGMVSADSTNGLGVNSPPSSIYFTNCSTWTNAAAPTGCSNTTWYGVTSAAAAATVVTCSTGSGSLTANFSYLKIEVRSTTDVHFFADYNTSDGINESECGTGSTTNVSASAMTAWLEARFTTNTATSVVLQVDYFRSWQDDNVDPPGSVETTIGNNQVVTDPPLAVDSESTDENMDSFLGLDAAASEETAGQNNAGSSGPSPVAGSASSSHASFSSLDLSDGLVIGGDAEFHGNALFYKLVTFSEKTFFNNDITLAGHILTGGNTLNADVGSAAGIIQSVDGQANIAKVNVAGNDNSGQLTVTVGDNSTAGELAVVHFDKPFDKTPQVFFTPTSQSSAQQRYYISATKSGFTIILLDPPQPGSSYSYNYWVAQ